MDFTDQFILYMWISFYCFLLAFTVILGAKIYQYYQRWGDTRADGVEYKKLILNIPVNGISVKINGMSIAPSDQSNNKTILLIPPYTVSMNRYLYFATALALNGFKVTLIESRQTNTEIKRSKVNATGFIASLMESISPNSVIASDIFFSLLLPEMLQESNIKYIIVRPSLIDKQLHPILCLALNIPWLSNFIYFLRQAFHEKLYSVKSNTLLIFPRLFISNPSICITENNLIIQQIRSRFSFREKETMIFAYILKFIKESSV